jgi:aminopeptidase
MADTFETKLDRYATLIVKVGVNVQPGQTVVVNAPLNAAPLVRLIGRKAYEAGAKDVHVEWSDEELTRIKYDLAPDEAFREYPMWKAKGYEEMAEAGACFISIKPPNPDLLKGVDPERIATANKTANRAMHKFRSYTMSDRVSWTVVSVASPEWADKVFPDLPPSEREAALWEAIFKAVRADLDDPIGAWQAHQERLNAKAEMLNRKRYKALHFEAPGTQLTVGLPEGHLWVSGASVNERGVPFMANMPTEEVFTAPHRDRINGTVRSTKPLSYGGNLITNFSFTFKDGKIVDYSAETGGEVLGKLLEMDEGSRRLGELALVPHQSPISQSNLVFYNTLFDENASNHLAIGNAYAFCLEGGKSMSEEEVAARGLNRSLAHVDFMIGSAEMNIDGETEDGRLEPVFRNGNWAE